MAGIILRHLFLRLGTLRFDDELSYNAMNCEERLGRAASALRIKKSLRLGSISTTRLYQCHCIGEMCSFQKARDALLVAYDSSLIDSDEFVLLYATSQRLDKFPRRARMLSAYMITSARGRWARREILRSLLLLIRRTPL